jgi:hypothetical protein
MNRVYFFVKCPQKFNRVNIFSSAILIGNPFTLLARIIQVKHRCDRIHTQPVAVALFQPENRARYQETAHLVPAVVENITLPVWMITLAWIFMLKKMRSIKIRQSILIRREMRWYPVENYADVVLVKMINHLHEFIRISKPARRCKIPQRLVAPRTVKRMLHYRHEFNMCKSHFLYVLGQLVRKVRVAQKLGRIFNPPAPRAKVNLVYRHRC